MIYVMSDIHGQKRRFDSVMKQINLQPEDTLYVLGDVIDRNPDGIKILRQIMAMSNAKMLLGNHELMMMNALYYPPPPDSSRIPPPCSDHPLNLFGTLTRVFWPRVTQLN